MLAHAEFQMWITWYLKSPNKHAVPTNASSFNRSQTYFGLVHTPVDIHKAMQIPDAKKALVEEWTKLVTRGAWDVRKVRARAEVEKEAISAGKPAHFGSLMDLCHIKNSQLGKEFWRYKGRVVFRGDIVKNEKVNNF